MKRRNYNLLFHHVRYIFLSFICTGTVLKGVIFKTYIIGVHMVKLSRLTINNDIVSFKSLVETYWFF